MPEESAREAGSEDEAAVDGDEAVVGGGDETAAEDGATQTDGEPRKAGPGEAYCPSCGRLIEADASFCPHCGEGQPGNGSTEATPARGSAQRGGTGTAGTQLTPEREAELKSLADTDKAAVAIISFLITPVGYLMVDRVGLAILNFLTFNFLLLGPLIVPLHTYKLVSDAEEELRAAGVEGY